MDPFDSLTKTPPKIRKVGEVSVEREIPHSIAAEQGVLGAILLEPLASMNACVEAGVTAAWFYDLRNTALYELLDGMFDRQEKIDTVTLARRGAGDVAYLASLPEACPSVSNLETYIAILKEKNVLRKMLELCAATTLRIKSDRIEPEKLVDEVEREITAIRGNDSAKQTKPIKELVRESIDSIQRWHQRQGQLGGIATGLRDLDKLTDGLHGGELIILAARPSLGKTSLAMNIVEHATVDNGIPSGVFSLEMTADSLATRMLCSRARVNMKSVQQGFLTDTDFMKLTNCAGKIAKSPMVIDDASGISIQQLRARARRMQQRHGIKLIVVDYLQLVTSTTSRKGDTRQQEVSEVSAGLKAIAKELNIPVLALCQLNRDLEKRGKDATPRLSDIKESGSIEQDADVVLMLSRTNEGDESDADSVAVNLLIAKQRNGPAGVDVPMIFRKTMTRFEQASPIKE